MPIEFRLEGRLGGFAAETIGPGEEGWICQRELVGPSDAAYLVDRLEKFQEL